MSEIFLLVISLAGILGTLLILGSFLLERIKIASSRKRPQPKSGLIRPGNASNYDLYGGGYEAFKKMTPEQAKAFLEKAKVDGQVLARRDMEVLNNIIHGREPEPGRVVGGDSLEKPGDAAQS